MSDTPDRQTFFAQWRDRVRTTLPKFKSQLAKLGIFGSAAASIAILASTGDPTLTLGFITGIAGSFIAGLVERWRSAPADADHDALLQQIAADVAIHHNDPQVQSAFQQLDLIAASIGVIDLKLDELTEFLRAGFATPLQIETLNAQGSQGMIVNNLGVVNQAFNITEAMAHNVEGLPNPFLGLRAFTYEDHAAYAGRSRSIEEAVVKLTQPGEERTLLFVTGASGSGKSSFAQAGLVPALEAFYAERHCKVHPAIFHPAAHPMAMLKDAFLKVGVQNPADRQPSADPIILIIDQFEELFTQSQAAERDDFFAWLGALPSFQQSRMHVIATLRSDYLGDLLQHEALWNIAIVGVVLRAMSADDLREAIQRPGQARYPNGEKHFQPELLDRLVADASGDASLLPLLQVTLEEIWTKGRLTVGNYSTLTDAIRERADQVYTFEDYDAAAPTRPRTEAAHVAVLQMFLDLVRVSLDNDDRRDVRVSRPTAELGQDRKALVNDLVQARLLSISADSGIETVSIIHESLITNWELLGKAVQERRLQLQQRARFEQAVRDWIANGRSDEYLLSGAYLAQALDLDRREDVALRSPGARELLRRSRDNLVRRIEQRITAEIGA